MTDHHALASSAPDPPRAPWKGTARYGVIRMIGAGGMGIVYEAIDHERRQAVAVKTLRNVDPDALYRFKNEFRTLAGLHHPNLVRLHEFVLTDAGDVFFTMELVRGSDLRTYVSRDEIREARARRPPNSSSAPPTQPSIRYPAPAAATEGPAPESDPAPRPSPADIARLRAALLGLTEGLRALHAAGKLHRDIKPSNVLVTPEGRVVLLDFGVATELRGPRDKADETEMVGTATYMAPEQGAGETPTEASDWYSVGVVLYEALVGRPPFTGSTCDLLQRKNLIDVPAPSSLVSGVPADLDALCIALLDRDPARRPTGAAVTCQLRPIRPSRAPLAYSSLRPPATVKTVFVGREAQLRQLQEAFEAAKGGRSVTVRVGGGSGMGKSTLVARFVDGLSESGAAVVLRGRAYERESIPYKAVDAAIDALSRLLMRLSDEDPSLQWPADVAALARVFPVLRRVPSIASLPEDRVAAPIEVRRRAVSALRGVLATLTARHPLVVYIDDAQWGDTDSAALLVDLLRPPDAPPILVVMTYREEEAQASPFLTELRERGAPNADVREVAVGPLNLEDAERLAMALFENNDAIGERVARAAARESRGSPFLLEELVRSNLAAATASDGTLTVLTVEQMVGGRFEGLPTAVQRLLEMVAVGGHPLPIHLVADAASIHADVGLVVEQAAAGRFVRTGLRVGREVIEMSHDRIGQALVARLAPDVLSSHHARLAQVLEAAASTDLEAIAVHLQGANDPARAATYAERAAEQAAGKLAFDHAVRLYRMALEMTPSALSADARRRRAGLGQVLEWAGRGTAAAAVYLEAAESAPGLERVEFEQRAAEQLLATGRIDDGLAVLDRGLSFAGIRRPRSAVGAIFWLLVYRLWLRIGGVRFVERDPSQVERIARAKIDMLYALGLGLAVVDAVHAACMQARHVVLALRTGDPFQVLRAAAIEVSTLASAGGKVRPIERDLAALVERLGQGADQLEGQAFGLGTNGVALFLRGEWKRSLEVLDRAFAAYPNNRAGWHSNGRLFAIWALTYLGRIDEFRRRHASLLADAEQRGDLYTTVGLRIGCSTLAWLVEDDVDSARRHVKEAMAEWSARGFHVQHYRAMVADANVALYEGDGEQAYERVARDWKKLEKSFVLRVQYVRADAWFARARAALAMAKGSRQPARHVAEAERIARRLARENMPWIDVLAGIVRAGVARLRGDAKTSTDLLQRTLVEAEAADMAMHAAAIRRQLGLIAGDAGRGLVEQAEAGLTSQGVRAPERFAAMLVLDL